MADKENIIAIIADMDYTLTPDFMQKPLFEHYGHDPEQFWKESREEHQRLEKIITSEASFPKSLRAEKNQMMAHACNEVTYADMILEHIKKGCPTDGKKWEGLNRKLLRKLGKKVEFYRGLPEAIREEKEFVQSVQEWNRHNIKLEWHVVSLGIADMIRKSAIGKYLDGIFAYEFATAKGEDPATGLLDKVATPMLYANKTQYVYHLNKGPLINVNEKMAPELRRIPGKNMIYLGDGQSDVPAFAVMKRMEGKSIAVYSPREARCYVEAVKLYSEHRVAAIASGDYSWGSELRRILRESITKIAEGIVAEEMKTV